MDVWEFLVRSEWPALAGAVVWLLRRPLKRMADDIIPTKIELWGLKAELEKRLSAIEALTIEHAEFVAKNAPVMERIGLERLRDAWQPLEAEREHVSNLSKEDAQTWKQLQERKEELSHGFSLDEVSEFESDARAWLARRTPHRRPGGAG